MNSPDYVVLFMPLEGALATALSLDPELTSYGWKQGVVLTTPTTLMATLGIIAHLWRQENQQAHALEIARQSGALYDKFVGFVASLEEVGKHIERSQTAYQKAYNQLKTGRGNLIARAEGLRDMGAAASKRLPDGLVEAALDGDSMHSPVEAEV
jgi:DNA recombination protein RmuC